jgi:D-alanine-D-alanine ligase
MPSSPTSRLNLVAADRNACGTPIAVIVGGDAQRHYAARDNGRAIAQALVALGCEPVIVEAGRSLAARLQACGALTAVVAVLDGRLADGTVQELCRDLGIVCVGPPTHALRTCADKALASDRMADAGVSVPAQRSFTRAATVAAGVGAVLPRAMAELGEQVVIKPRWGHAGLGVKRVEAGTAAAAITNAFNYDNAVVVEHAVDGQELSVLMTGALDEPMAIGISKVSYESDEASAAAWARRYVPANDLLADVRRVAVRTARDAASALGLAGLTTVDMIVDATQTAWVIDVDGMLDWRAEGALAACLASSDLTEPQLLASLLRDVGASMRLAA